MTMSVVQIDLCSGETLISNAGHEAPLLLKVMNEPNSKNKCDSLFVRGERLGFAPESQFETLKIQLDIGDTILIFTDGISEAVNSENKQFGERALKKLFNRLGSLPLMEIKTKMFEELKIFMGNEPQQDDITYVLLKWHHQLEKIDSPPSQVALPHPITEPAPVTSEAPIYNEASQRIISVPSPQNNDTKQQPEVKDLNTLAKDSLFAEEEVDTHYARIEESMGDDSDPSKGEAA